MTEYKGVLEITDYAQKLINSGQARIEGANVVWNPGSGSTGVVEWGKFHLTNSEDNRDLDTVAVLGGGIAIGVVAVVTVGIIIYKGSKARQDKANRINNNLISCLSLYILEVSENTLQSSTMLDLKLAIKEYIDNSRLFKNKVDIHLLNSIDIVMSTIESNDKFELTENIIHLNDFIKRNNSNKSKKESLKSSDIRKID